MELIIEVLLIYIHLLIKTAIFQSNFQNNSNDKLKISLQILKNLEFLVNPWTLIYFHKNFLLLLFLPLFILMHLKYFYVIYGLLKYQLHIQIKSLLDEERT